MILGVLLDLDLVLRITHSLFLIVEIILRLSVPRVPIFVDVLIDLSVGKKKSSETFSRVPSLK